MTKSNSYNKQNDLREEYKLIQKKISDWDHFSLSIKNWAITIWGVIIIFIGTQYYTQKNEGIDLSILFWIPILLPIPFWFLDGLFKFFQRMSIIRGLAIEDYLNNSLFMVNDKINKRFRKRLKKLNEKPTKKTTIEKVVHDFDNNFPVYDPVGRVSKGFIFFDVKYNRRTNIFICLSVRMVFTIYFALIFLAILIIAIITRFCLISLIFIFLIPSLIVVSWILSSKKIL